MISIQLSFGQGLEDFTNMTLTGSSYQTGSFIGNNSITWNYTSCRGDQKIDGKAICTGKSTSTIQAENIPNGVGSLSFKYRQAFSKSSTMTISINGSEIEVVSVNSTTVSAYTKDVSVSGDFTIELKTTERVIIDDIEWTSYGSSSSQSSAKAITSFAVDGKSATIDESAHTLSLTVPASANLASLSPTIEISAKASILPASGSTVDFTNPVTYTVTAEDGSTQAYEITIAKETVVTSSLLINELDCDQAKNDEGKEDTWEFIELYDGGAGNSSLDGHVLVFYNGSNDESYLTIDLSGNSTNAEGFFVVGNSAVANVGVTFADNKLQNGADAVALYKASESDFSNGTAFTTSNLVDLLVYDTSDSDDAGLLAGLLSGGQINENGEGDKNNHSIYRATDGEGGARNTTAFVAGLPTPGKSNVNTDISVNIEFSANSGTEADATAITLTATASEAVSEDQTVDLSISGTGITSDDYTISASTLTILSGETIATTTLTIVDDSDEEGIETMTVSLSNPSAGIVLGTTTSGDISIIDNDSAGNDGSEAKPFTIAEAIALPNTEKTTKTRYFAYGYIVGVGNTFEGPFSSEYYVTVADSKDETNFDNCLNLKLEAGDNRNNWNLKNNPGNLGKQIKFDGYRGEYSSHQSFEGNAVIEELTGLALPSIELALSDNSGTEEDATAITLTVSTSEVVSENQSIDLGVSGTGITAGDYTLSTNQITIVAGESSATATLTIVDDSDEEEEETLTLTLSNPSAGIQLGSTITGDITIADNDNVNDGSEAKPFTITEAIALPNTEKTTKTRYYAYGYIVGVGDTFEGPFSSEYYITVADSKDETNFDNCLNLKLESGDNRNNWNLKNNPKNLGKQIKFDGYRGEYSSHQSFEGNAVIEELSSGPALPSLELALSSNSGAEADATAITLTVTSSETVSENQTVDVSISGTGITASDYTISATNLTILSGETTATATLTVVDDSDAEGTETMTVTLTNPSAGIVLGTTVAGNISIADNDGSAGSILDNYVYLDPSTSGDGSIVVNLTPKEYVATVSPSHHMTSVKIPADYYSDAVGLTGANLRDEIMTIISTGAIKLPYSSSSSDVWDMCEAGDQNPKNASQVWQMYVEEGIAKTAHVSGSTGWNREHTWAKSHGDFGTSAGPGTDGHHLRATDAGENSARGSRDFGNDSPGYTPPKSARGDVARMIFYMATRWEMTVDDQCKQTESAPRHGKLSHLLQWHEEDPVDPYEVRRNNVIFGFQNNRNPFVDHPELVQYIFGEAKDIAWNGGIGTEPSKITISGALADFEMVKFGEESSVQTFSILANELVEDIAITAPQHFLLSTDAISYTSSLSLPLSSGSLAETTISVKFVPESAVNTDISGSIQIVSGEESKTISVSGTEGDPALVPVAFFQENFETNTHANWILKSIVGDRNWEITEHSDNKYMQMSAYQASGDVVSWLITPAIDLDAYSNEKLNFKTKNGYYKGTTLEVLISTDFDGSDVATATWQSVPAIIDERNNSAYGSTFVESGAVDLSSYEGEVYLAFKYSGNGSSLTTTYQVDDVTIEGNKVPLTGTLTSNLTEDLLFPYTEAGDVSETKTYELSFDKLEGDISVKASDNYELSLDGIAWTSSLSIAKTEESPKLINIRFAPKTSAINGITGSITNKAKGAASLVINMSSEKSDEIADATTLGKDKTLDIVSWNIEWFGAPNKSKSASSFSEQLDAVSADIIAFDADVYALQELVSDDLNGDYLQPLVDKLNELAGSDSYAGIMGPRYSHDDSDPSTEYPAQRVCYVYNKTSVSKLNDFSMFSDEYQGGSTSSIDGYTGDASKFWASGRLPYFFEAEVNINGASERIAFVNIHAKCCYDSHSRKLADAKYLLNALNTDYPNDNLVILGDYNDYLEGSMSSGKASPYASWFETGDYFDHVLTSTTNIDHISISNELYDEYQILTNNTSQTNTSISDHHPIMLRLKLHAYSSQILAENADDLNFDFVDVENSEAPSAAKTYTIKGIDLEEDLTVSVDQSFELSLDGSTWASSVSIAKEEAASKQIQIRFNPTVAYTEKVSANITHKSNGAKTLRVPVLAYGKPDLLAPEFVSGYPNIDSFTSSSFVMNVKLNEEGKVFFVVLADNADVPSIEAVKAGTDAIVAGSFDIATDEIAHEVVGLTKTTDYDVYLVAEDDNEPVANTSTAVTKLEVKTNDHILLPYEYISTVTAGEHYESTGIPVNYYQEAEGTKADVLKDKLADIINAGFVSYPYEEEGRGDVAAESRRFVTGAIPLDVYDIMDEADRDPNNPSKVYMIYKEMVYDADAKHLGLNGSQEKWNREHVYPQSTGGFKNARAPWGSGSYANGNIIENAGDDLALAQSDAHHLRSSDKNENNKRNNFPFANSTSGSKYAPPLSAKGDVARVIFYLNLRYGLDISQVGSVEMFKEWSELDPVDPYEVRHNNVVYKYQKNRNPFIDYPELVEYIYGDKITTAWKAVEKETQTITFTEIPDKVYDDEAFNLVASSTSGLNVTFELVSGPADVVGNVLTITGAGTVVVKATQVGNDDFEVAEPVNQSFIVDKANQTLTFTEIADKLFGDEAFKLVASATSELEVGFSVMSGPAIISGDELTITGVGYVTLEAFQSGNDNYTAAESKYRNFEVSKASQVITFEEIADKIYGVAPFKLVASSSSELEVSFNLISGPATVSGDELTITGVGNVTVEAEQLGNYNYVAAETKSRTFKISKAAQVITFDAIADKAYGEAPFTLVASSTSNLAVDFNVISGPAEITGDELTITGVGSVTVVASQTGDENYNEADPASRTFTVSKAVQEITFEAITDKVYGDAPFTLVASSSSNLAVSFNVVSGPATITGDELTITGTGNVTVEASQAGNDTYAAAEAKSRTFTVSKAAQLITFDAIADKVYGDAPFTLVASSSSNLAVSFNVVSGPATITGDELTITGTGNVTVEATQSGNEMYATAEAKSRTFTV
ncbi:endonuclease, partial [Marinifilum sp. N1E240]|uniref:endonuclease n=1 Tax=Marinifilum sp. N1E240 TaxID=2608082 RepID=UPI00186B7701